MGNKKLGIKYLLIFTLFILIYTLISYGLRFVTNHAILYDYPLSAKNVLGTLGFQLLLSGTSEEVLFRALPIGMLTFFNCSYKKRKFTKFNISYEVIIAAIWFALAHIRWSINPFSISMDYLQLVYCLVLGIAYGKVYEESKSVIYPMIMHSISNVLVVGLGYIFSLIRV